MQQNVEPLDREITAHGDLVVREGLSENRC